MAAYAAVVSLSKTLRQLANTPNHPYPQIAQLLKGVDSLRRFLGDNREVKRDFEIKIRDVVYDAQDIIDPHISSTHDVLSPSEAEIKDQRFSQDLERVEQKISSIAEMTKSEKFDHQTLDRKINNSLWKKSDKIDCRKSYSLVGRDEDWSRLEDRLMRGSPSLQVIPIVGIAGMGKSALAKCIYNTPFVKKHFNVCGGVIVPVEYKKRDVLLSLLKTMKYVGDEIHQKTDDQLAKHFFDFLKHKKYLLVLEDIRDVAVWDDFKELFPDFSNGSRILLTTRNMDVGRITGFPHLLDRVSDEHTLVLLRKVVFNDEPCPRQLVLLEEDIAKSCRGLPHAVIIVGRLLKCAELSAEYWEIVLSSISFCKNYDQLTETLVSLTYKHLPQQLKPCLLHMAMFPYDYDIPVGKLQELWTAEGFIEIDKRYTSLKTEVQNAEDCFLQLHKRAIMSFKLKFGDAEEVCSIDEKVFHEFLMRTAMEEKFFLVINKNTNRGGFLQEKYRRLFVHKNIVPYVIHNSHSRKSSSTARSLLYHGPEHKYPLPAWLEDFKLLRVLDAHKIRFYQLPAQILNFIHLTYLALTYNGQLPAAVCKLPSLQVLIFLHYLSVKCSGAPSYLPLEIWNMRKLRYLQVQGSDFPDIPLGTALDLENLTTFLDASAHSCTLQNLERIRNLYELGILIESLPEDESLSFVSHLHILNRLSVFKCVVIYPNVGSQVVPCPIPAFPSTLRRLSLSGCGFPWIYMSVIAALPNLTRLELKNYAFQGPVWEVKKDEFPRLVILLLEDMDLKNWILPDKSCFPMLNDLLIRNCYTLQKIPNVIGDIPNLRILHVVDCSTSVVNSALKIQEEKLRRGNDSVQFELYSSQDD